MPQKDQTGRSGREELPDTLKGSSKKAQRTWLETHDSAVKEYGDGERAHRTAFASLKHSFEKVGDRWVAKGHKGPSDPRSANPRAREGEAESFGGVDYYGHTMKELYERAKGSDISGRSKMSKAVLARAIAKKQG